MSWLSAWNCWERFGEEALPEARGLGVGVFADGQEEGLVFARGEDLAFEIAGELGAEDRMRELLEQDGRKIEIAVERDVVAVEAIERAEQREIGFRGGLEKPLDAVGPTAMVDDIGQMGVQRQGKKSTRLRRWLSHKISISGCARPAGAQVGGAG